MEHDRVPLRELLEEKIQAAQSREHDDIQRNRERLAWMLTLGAFAWTQVQRRLEILSHENQRVAAIAEKTVSDDTYDSDESRRSAERSQLDEWRKEVDIDRSRSVTRDEFQRDTKKESRAQFGTWQAVLVTVVALAGLYLAYHRHIVVVQTPPSTVTTTTPAAQ